MRYDDGFWNEWYLWFEDGSDGWLSDASGQYAVTRRRRAKTAGKCRPSTRSSRASSSSWTARITWPPTSAPARPAARRASCPSWPTAAGRPRWPTSAAWTPS
ncbi:hypothetical protein WJ970_28860 [Achromobacter xylosoxidans]